MYLNYWIYEKCYGITTFTALKHLYVTGSVSFKDCFGVFWESIVIKLIIALKAVLLNYYLVLVIELYLWSSFNLKIIFNSLEPTLRILIYSVIFSSDFVFLNPQIKLISKNKKLMNFLFVFVKKKKIVGNSGLIFDFTN